MSGNVDHAIFRIAEALEIPVLLLALVALACVLVEAGTFIVELSHRRRRNLDRLTSAAATASHAAREDRRSAALASLLPLATSQAMAGALERLVSIAHRRLAEERMAKVLADFDYASLRRLERTRLLVRFGPALGLMGTLIPLSPALAALARGDVKTLSDNLRVAFGVTVLGLLVGAAAFAISLVRDRLYGQDLSDLQYVAAMLSAEDL